MCGVGGADPLGMAIVVPGLRMFGTDEEGESTAGEAKGGRVGVLGPLLASAFCRAVSSSTRERTSLCVQVTMSGLLGSSLGTTYASTAGESR